MKLKNSCYKLKVILLITLLFPAYLGVSAQDKSKAKPNIIFIFADDLGWGDLSCYGNNRVKTPELDRLASEGTLFTQFYVAGSVCSPSRAAIMTGQYPARNRIFGHIARKEMNEQRKMPSALNPDLYTLTDMLKEQGYTTAHFGKWHLGNVYNVSPEDFISPGDYGIDVYRTDKSANTEAAKGLDIWSPKARPTCTKDILDEAARFIEKQDGKPFYANVWFTDVHATLNPSKEQMERVTRENGGQKPIPGVEYSGVEHVYHAALLEMDKQIGLFLDKLNKMGLRENTLIIFSSDNGPEDYQINNSRHSGVGSTGPFRGRKRSIYEGGIRVPFILRWPGQVPAQKVNDQSVINGVDFLPTIAGIIGVKLPGQLVLDGEDMSKAWMGADTKRERTLYWEWRYSVFGHMVNRPPMIAVRDGDYKLLINPNGTRPELYNIIEDPSELMNLINEKPKLVKELSAKAIAWFNELPESPWDSDAGANSWKIPK